jgi:hypothetical protein
MMRSPFPDADSAELRELAASAGLRDVRLRIVIASARYPSAEDLVRFEAASSPLAAPLAALDEATRDALVRDVATGLRPCTDDDGVVFPQETAVVTGHR